MGDENMGSALKDVEHVDPKAAAAKIDSSSPRNPGRFGFDRPY